MKKWIKRFMLGLALLLSVTALLSAGGFALIRRTPEFYHHSLLTAAQRAAAAARAESKVTDMENMVADSHGSEIQAINAASRPAPAAHTFTFTEDELNSLFNKWSDLHDWREFYERYIDDPVIILQPGKVILAGKLRFKDLDTVVSMHFQPRITADGKLDMNLVSILGGRLPLPQETIIAPMREKMNRYLAGHFPAWREKAQIDPTGATNEDAMKTALGKLALRASNHQPGDPVVFFPLVSHGLISVPVKLTAIAIDKGTMSLTVVPMNSVERAALLDRIKQPSEIEANQ